MPECTPERYQQLLARAVFFWEHLDQSNPDACWVWGGRIHPLGYGIFKCNQRQWMAHRVAWILTHGPITPKEHVLHRCDNPPCCNPAHHFIGDQNVNMADMVAKGRQCRGEDRNLINVKGTAHPNAKLCDDDVRLIRQSDGTQEEIAERFGMSRQVIGAIRRGEMWKHVI